MRHIGGITLPNYCNVVRKDIGNEESCGIGVCLIRPGCLWPSIALTVQNNGLKHIHSFTKEERCTVSLNIGNLKEKD